MRGACFLFVLLIGASNADFLFTGVNEAGMEQGEKFFNSQPGTNYGIPTATSINAFRNIGMNVIRIPFRWERLQNTLGGPLNSTHLKYVMQTVNTATNGTPAMYALIDPHNYARYDGKVLRSSKANGTGPTYEEFADFWTKLANVFKNNSKVLFGLMNEPNKMPNEDVFGSMQAAVTAIRATGAKNFILVPGNYYTGAHNWMSTNGGKFMINITDPLNRFIFEMHQYFDEYSTGTKIAYDKYNVTKDIGPTTDWLRSNRRTAFLGEFAIELNRTICTTILNQVMTYLKANSDVWVGWTWWGAGPWWKDDYMYKIEPYKNGTFIPGSAVPILKNYIPKTYEDIEKVWGTSGRMAPGTLSTSSTSGRTPGTVSTASTSSTSAAVMSTSEDASSYTSTGGATGTTEDTKGNSGSTSSTNGSTSSTNGSTSSTNGSTDTVTAITSSDALVNDATKFRICGIMTVLILAMV